MSAISVEQIPSGTYAVDPTHSNVGFEVRHMGVATVRGSSHLRGNDRRHCELAQPKGAVDVSSVDTNEANRDGHLQSPEFFDAAQYPKITFSSTSANAGADGAITLAGEITIKGVTKPIELTGTLGDGGEDPWGHQRIGFEVASVIDRREFDLSWNQTLPNGSVLVANEVKLVVSVSAVKGRNSDAVLGISGSLRAASTTRRCCARPPKGAPDGVEVELRRARGVAGVQRGPRHREPPCGGRGLRMRSAPRRTRSCSRPPSTTARARDI